MLESAAEAQGHFPREARGGAATPAEPRGPAGSSRGTPGGGHPHGHPQPAPPGLGDTALRGQDAVPAVQCTEDTAGTPLSPTRDCGGHVEVRAISPAELAQSCPHRATPDPRGHRGAGGFLGDSMKPRGWCHRSSGSANHPGSKSSSCCRSVLKEDQVGDPVALSIAPGLSPALGMAPALCWAPGSPRQSCSPVLHLQADAAELQPALCTSATSFNLGQEEQSPAFPMGMYCIPGLLCSLPG